MRYNFLYNVTHNAPGSMYSLPLTKRFDPQERVLQLIGEVDYAVERHARMLKEEKEKKQQILDSKLKPKGTALIENE